MFLIIYFRICDVKLGSLWQWKKVTLSNGKNIKKYLIKYNLVKTNFGRFGSWTHHLFHVSSRWLRTRFSETFLSVGEFGSELVVDSDDLGSLGRAYTVAKCLATTRTESLLRFNTSKHSLITSSLNSSKHPKH